MNKLAFLPLLILSACAWPGENARLTQAALDHDRTACVARDNKLGTDDYARCMLKLGHRDGYLVTKADNGNIAFVLPGEGPIPGNLTGVAPTIPVSALPAR